MFLLPISRYDSDATPVVTICVAVSSSVLWLVLWLTSYPVEVFTNFGFVAAQPHPLTMISALFIHQGLLYLLPNVIFLALLGRQLEDAFGHLMFLALFMVCGITSMLLLYVLHPGTTVIVTGSTGAVAGVIAAFWIIFPEQVFDVQVHLGWWHVTDFEAKTYAVFAAWVGWQFIVGLVGGRMPRDFIIWANVGGFGTGLAIALLLKPMLLRWRKQRRSEPEPEITLTSLQL